ncbi:nitrate- and nitrite sensing domain-containing protein [Cellvibrio sp. ARAG 10.3]|uniref:nitrate- and nitrite sensing domain-containing protein n=1 Tax=Cellvibrio sp. ARAG 10.3 TaxID=3451358 RepID=UPI003F448414
MADVFSLLFILLPLIFIAFIFYCLHRRRVIVGRLVDQGLNYVRVMRTLLTHVQQHRGLTTGFLNGNQDAKAEIQALQNKIRKEIVEVNNLGVWVQANEKWRSILDHWSRLSSHYASGEAMNNLKQHNQLIANILYFIEDIADAHHLDSKAPAAFAHQWRSLLFIAESIGQARALGTGVVAKGECSSVLRIQLNHLRNKIASHTGEYLSPQAWAEIEQLLHCIETDVVIDQPTISPKAYFQLATRSLERVMEQFDQYIEGLRYQGR